VNQPSIATIAEPTDAAEVGSIEKRHMSIMDELRADAPQSAGEVE